MHITRNITTYIYSYGEYDAESGMVVNVFTETRAKPLGPRVYAKHLEELRATNGKSIIAMGVKEDTALYRMEVERFIELAERVESTDVKDE